MKLYELKQMLELFGDLKSEVTSKVLMSRLYIGNNYQKQKMREGVESGKIRRF